MAQGMTPDEVKQHFSVPGMEGCYLLLCDGTAVNVRSQQVRALNLLHSLKHEVQNKRIAVIGGGAAGLTFAAGAASLGGEVTLFEKSPQLLHMQLGCWHRPLHPEIFSWPSDTAYRPVSHLPQLGWTTGRAHDVADAILAQFWGIQTKLKESLKVCCGTVVQVTPDKRIIPHDVVKPFNTVVLAVGFGFEKLPYRLPWNSYWRVDPLDQTLLGDDEGAPVVVVVGSGDGALIEIIRSCVQSFEQGALLDGILNAALDGKVDGEDKTLRDEVKRIENEKEVSSENRFDEYCGLSSADVDAIILDNLRNTKVYWLIREYASGGGRLGLEGRA